MVETEKQPSYPCFGCFITLKTQKTDFETPVDQDVEGKEKQVTRGTFVL